ncbi:MAG: hypothetical protein ACKOSO_12495 [Actinomycetota bacterium]
MIPVTGPSGLALSPDGSALFVSRSYSFASPRLTRFNVDDFSTAVPIDIIGSGATGMAVVYQGRVATIASDGQYTEVYPSTDAIVVGTPFASGASAARDVALVPGTRLPYVLNGPTGSAGSLLFLSPSTSTVSTITNSLPAQSRALAVSPNGAYAYVAHTFDATLRRVTLTGGSLGTIASVALPGGAGGYDVVVDATGAYAYVAGAYGTVSRVRLSDFSAAGSSVDLGDGEVRTVAMSADGNHVFAAFEGSGGAGPTTFVALDATTLEVVRTLELPAGSNPRSIAATTGYAYVALQSAGTGAVMRIELRPDAPTALAATAGDGSARIAFTVDDAQLRTIQYSVDDGDWTGVDPAGTSSPVTIRGLANGRAHSIRLRAVDGLAVSPASDAVSVTPVAAPADATKTSGAGAGTTLRTAKAKTTKTAITTSFTASGPGTATITRSVVTAKRAGRAKAVTACTGKATVRKAGTVAMTCTLTKQAKALRRKGSVTVRLVTAFTPKGGARATGTQTVVLRRG